MVKQNPSKKAQMLLTSRLRALGRALCLPRQRCMMLAIVVVSLLMYTLITNPDQNRILSEPNALSLKNLPVTTLTNQQHPILGLIKAGEKKWKKLLNSQSRTLAEAVAEYRRRYSIPPPDGFDLWFSYAQKHKSILIDEYDDLMDTLAPLRILGHKEVRRRSEITFKFGMDSMDGLVVNGGSEDVFTYWSKGNKEKLLKRSLVVVEGEEDSGGFRTVGFLRMLEPIKGLIAPKAAKWPAFSIAVNELAESRVVGGEDSEWSSDTEALVARKETFEADEILQHHEPGERTLAKGFVKACGPHSEYARRESTIRYEFGIREVFGATDGGLKGEGMPPRFIEDPEVDNDICQRPELLGVHGVFRGTSVTTKGLYPILSYGRPSAFSDIPIPSRFQWDIDGSYSYIEEEDVPWESKVPMLYWRGDPSGGGGGDKSYGSMHRHRLAVLTNPKYFRFNVNITGATADNMITHTIQRADIAQHLVNVSLTDIRDGCEQFGCDLQKIFVFEERNDFREAWRNKMVIDSDGWGPSGRWRALISSQSLAVRSSVYREWFGRRMIPWVHYVPASVGLGELWGLLGYFFGTPGGGVPHDEEARKIAEQGAQWAKEHMRPEDMTIYCFRLLLELNRLFNGEEWSYKA